MNADSYNGFVYAIKDNAVTETNRVIYVEIIFCNYFLDLEYEKYIPQKYLPPGFNAHMDNPYQTKEFEKIDATMQEDEKYLEEIDKNKWWIPFANN
ncbi:MAG: hypothetical protein IJI67_04205 [Clostridia bacterium]|nr:hypothetical protein [Clostridia bacterium]